MTAILGVITAVKMMDSASDPKTILTLNNDSAYILKGLLPGSRGEALTEKVSASGIHLYCVSGKCLPPYFMESE